MKIARTHLLARLALVAAVSVGLTACGGSSNNNEDQTEPTALETAQAARTAAQEAVSGLAADATDTARLEAQRALLAAAEEVVKELGDDAAHSAVEAAEKVVADAQAAISVINDRIDAAKAAADAATARAALVNAASCTTGTRTCLNAHDALIAALQGDVDALARDAGATNAQQTAAQMALSDAQAARGVAQMAYNEANPPPPPPHVCASGASEACVTARQAELDALTDEDSKSDHDAAEQALADAQAALRTHLAMQARRGIEENARCDAIEPACLAHHDDLIDALEDDLAALQANPEATVAEINAARAALEAAKMTRAGLQMAYDEANPPPAPPEPHICDAGPSQECVDARQAELDDLDPDVATVTELASANMALQTAQRELGEKNAADAVDTAEAAAMKASTTAKSGDDAAMDITDADAAIASARTAGATDEQLEEALNHVARAREIVDVKAKVAAALAENPKLANEPSEQAVIAARSVVRTAYEAITNASYLTPEEKAEYTSEVDGVDSTVAVLEKRDADAAMAKQEEEDKAKAAASLKRGNDVFAALAGTSSSNNALANSTNAGDDSLVQSAIGTAGAKDVKIQSISFTPAVGAGAVPSSGVDPDLGSQITANAPQDQDVPSIGNWAGTKLASSAVSTVITTGGVAAPAVQASHNVRVYANRKSAEKVSFLAKYGTLSEDGEYTVVPADTEKVEAAAFEHDGVKVHKSRDDDGDFETKGKLDGVSGTYRCAAAGEGCTSTNDGKGTPSALAASVWFFKPDNPNALVDRQADDEYLYFGWWERTHGSTPVAANAFYARRGTAENVAGWSGGYDALTGANTLEGNAVYNGKAAGKAAFTNPSERTGDGGHFTADAKLTATFSAEDSSEVGVTGMISGFRLNEGTPYSTSPSWKVELTRAAFGDNGLLEASGTKRAETIWHLNDTNAAPASGSWAATMYDETDHSVDSADISNVPTTAIGRFYSEFDGVGRMVGAFGVEHDGN